MNRPMTRVSLALGAGFAVGVFCFGQATASAADSGAGARKSGSMTLSAGADQNGRLKAVVPTTIGSQKERDAFIRRILPMMGSTKGQRIQARRLGVAKIKGKALPGRPARDGSRPRNLRNGIDNNVTGDYYGWYGAQNEPSVATSSLDSDLVVAFTHNEINYSGLPNACSVYLSFDAGQTFYYDSDVAHTTASPFCSDPVARFSPDGYYLYLSYLDIDNSTGDDFVKVQVRLGYQPNLVFGQSDVFTGTGGDFVDKNWVDVHTWDTGSGQGSSGAGASVVHVTTTLFDAFGGCSIIYNRSTDYGFTWDFGAFGAFLLSSDCSNPDPLLIRLLQGSRPAGGPGPQAIVCAYDSGVDGWSPGVLSGTAVNNLFNIACMGSQDYGATWYGPFFPSSNIKYETAYYLGPNYQFMRISAAGFPAVTMDSLANVHLAFGADPNSNPRDAEAGNVYYQRSVYDAVKNPLMLVWPKSKAQGSGGGAQFFPAVVTQPAWETVLKPYVWLAYYDTKRSLKLGSANQNLIYDVYTRFSNNNGSSFKPAKLTSDASSLVDYSFIGDYLDASANRRNFHVVWTDRADATSIYNYEDDVFHDRFAPLGSN